MKTNIQTERLQETQYFLISENREFSKVLENSNISQKGNEVIQELSIINGFEFIKEIEFDEQEFFAKSHTLKNIFLGNFSEEFQDYSGFSDLNWEYILVVDNPDSLHMKQEEIRKSQAEDFFKSCFYPREFLNPAETRINECIELHAFLLAFNTLSPLGKGKKKCFGNFLERNSRGNLYNEVPLAKDFITLARNAIVFKLEAHLGLTVKEVISMDLEKIYILVKGNDEIIQREAEKLGYLKELDLSMTDLMSFEPCDANFRPLSIIKIKDQEILELFEEAEHLPNFMQWNRVLYMGSAYEPEGMSQEMWITYRYYLTLLMGRVESIHSHNLPQHHKNVAYLKAMRICQKKANERFPKAEIEHMWNRLNVQKPPGPLMKFTNQTELDWLKYYWKTNKTDIEGKREIFKGFEQIEIINSYIYTRVALYELLERKILVSYFPCEDFYRIYGHKDVQSFPEVESEKMDVTLRLALRQMKSSLEYEGLVEIWKVTLLREVLPLNKIRNLFGEKIALYFEFLLSFQKSLLIASILGFLIFVFQLSLKDDKLYFSLGNIGYAVFMIVWGSIFVDQWKKKEFELSILWKKRQDDRLSKIRRPEFKGESKRSLISDEIDEKYYPIYKRSLFYALTTFISFLLILLAGICFATVVLMWNRISDTLNMKGIDLAAILCAMLNAALIKIFNYLYSKIVRKLNDLENHEYQSDYDSSLILKRYVFEFFTSFGTLFYIAFLKSDLEGCAEWNFEEGTSKKEIGSECSSELYLYLFAIFAVTYSLNIGKSFVAYIKSYIKTKNEEEQKVQTDPLFDTKSIIESEFEKKHYMSIEDDGTIDDYLELVVLYGFLSLFAVALPISSSLTFIGLWIKMHTQRYKFLYLIRRPVPLSQNSIGVWWNILLINNVLSILSNTGIICFTKSSFTDWEFAENNIFLVYAMIVGALLIIRSYIRITLNSERSVYNIIKERHDYIISKLLLKTHSITTEEKEILNKIDYKIYGFE